MAIPVERELETKVVEIPTLAAGFSDHGWLAQEIRKEMARVALEEVQREIRRKNIPTHVELNRKTVVELSNRDVQYLLGLNPRTDNIFPKADQISWYFMDHELLYEVVAKSYKALVRRLPKKTRRGVGTIYFWVQNFGGNANARKVDSLKGVKTWLETEGNAGASIHMIGPTLEYRRHMIYGAKRKSKLWTTARNANRGNDRGLSRYDFSDKSSIKTGDKGLYYRLRSDPKNSVSARIEVTKAVQSQIRDIMRRNYRGINITYGFTKSRERLPIFSDWKPDGENIHVPVMRFFVKKSNYPGARR